VSDVASDLAAKQMDLLKLIKELKKAGFPLNRAISLIWGAVDGVKAAGWDVSQGYLGL
jgi:hypothetical protein